MQEDRLKKILSLIEQNRSISVNELKDQLYVSAATIRRDLAELARRGMIVRSFGGALSVSSDSGTPRLPTAESTPIGAIAAELVKNRSVIFLDSSPLTLSMTPHLTQRTGLTVVTDSMRVADALCGRVSRLYCTGGRYVAGLGVFTGQQAADLVERFRFDQCFISCDALTPDGYLAYYGIERMPVLKAAVTLSRTRVLLCSANQLGQYAPNAVVPLRNIDITVTDFPDGVNRDYTGAIIGTERKKPAK